MTPLARVTRRGIQFVSAIPLTISPRNGTSINRSSSQPIPASEVKIDMKSYLSLAMLLSAAVLSAGTVRAAETDTNWSQWRGPHFDGTSDAKNLPTEFGKNKNLLWEAKLPGNANNTPVHIGDRVFTTAVDGDRQMSCQCV